jgi:two-component system, OmpR family, lantibiotic biosynthesis sensor histidine kinase NisK/SpaK
MGGWIQMEAVKKQKSISKIFASYIVIFCITAVILMMFDLGLFTIGFSSGVILQANYYEKQIEHRLKM